MIINFKQAVFDRLNNLYLKYLERSLTLKEMEELDFLFENYSHFFEKENNDE